LCHILTPHYFNLTHGNPINLGFLLQIQKVIHMIVNRQQLADILGVTLPTIDARVAKGLPYKTKGKEGRSYEFETKEVIDWILEQAEKSSAKSESDSSYNEARRRKMNAEADLTEIQLAKEAGLVVMIDDAVNCISDAVSTLRTQCLNLPRRAAPLVVGETDEAIVKVILDEQVNEVLTELSQTFEQEVETLKP